MSNIKELRADEAKDVKADVIEQKIDGCCMTFDGQDLISERGIVRNDRFPRVLRDLRRLDWKVQGEIAIHNGHVLDINQKINWPKGKFHIFNITENQGKDVSGESPAEIRKILESIVIHKRFWRIWLPKRFKTFQEGWDFVKAKRDKDQYAEGIVLKGDKDWKVKLYTEEKLPIVRHEPGKVKGNFILDRNGVECGISGTSVGYVQRYNDLLTAGKVPYIEFEYLFLTDAGKPFQPRIRNLDTLDNL